MADGLYVALSGAVAQEAALDTSAHNLANAQTPGFQRARAVFSEVLAGQASTTHYTQVAETALDTTPGALEVTGRPLDAALPEGQYLAVQTPAGERYTRAVHLTIGDQGTLMAGSAPAMGEGGGPITVSREGGPIALTRQGDVTQDGAVVGRLRVVSFGQARSLAREGSNVLAATAASGAAQVTTASLEVGAIEQSNTQAVTAMTDLVSITRNFDAFQRAIDAFRTIDQKVIDNVVGG